MTQAESSPAFGRFVSRYRWIYCYTASHQLTSEGFQQAGLATDSGGDGDFIWPHLFLLSSSDSRFLSQWNQILAFKQQRSLGAFSRHKLGPAPHFLSCSHTATCLLQVWDGVLLQPGPPQGPSGPRCSRGSVEGREACSQADSSLSSTTGHIRFCVQLQEIGSELLPSALAHCGCHNQFYHRGGFNHRNAILSQSGGQK